MRRTVSVLAVAAVAAVAVVNAASGIVPVTSAFGYGTITTSTANQFYFEGSTTANGSGGSGTITLFDPSTQHFIGATVSCLFVNSSTGVATIWGNVTDPHTNAAPPGSSGSVLIKAAPGSGSGAGLNIRTYYSSAPTTCGNEGPGTGPVTAGVIQTTAGP